jgi:hypothetical protein
MGWDQCLTIIITTIGAAGSFFWITRSDMQKMEANHREDMKQWAVLFEKFHILDKDVEKFRVKDPDVRP